MPAAFVIHKAASGQFYFTLTAENNEVVLTNETYRDKDGAQKGIRSVRDNAPLDERHQRKTAADGKPYFVLVAANGEPIGHSETYSSTQAMEGGVAAVKRVAVSGSVRDEA
ncbi:MAG: YegP family protein [Chloroflexota bacterium]